ncbi:MAG: hypothetical protein ABL927_15570 [Bdellovibrionales bacterium]
MSSRRKNQSIKAKQLAFSLLADHSIKHFGGSYLKNSNPKKTRPLSIKRPIHLVMRSSMARGSRSLLKKSREVFDIVQNQSKMHGVTVYRYANAGNHLHMIILPRSAVAYRKFIRATSGLIARLILGVERGSSLMLSTNERKPSKPNDVKKINEANNLGAASIFIKVKKSVKNAKKSKVSTNKSIKFWDQRPFTRIVEWGRDFNNSCKYLRQNTLEAIGFLEYKTRRFTRQLPQRCKSFSTA